MLVVSRRIVLYLPSRSLPSPASLTSVLASIGEVLARGGWSHDALLSSLGAAFGAHGSSGPLAEPLPFVPRVVEPPEVAAPEVEAVSVDVGGDVIPARFRVTTPEPPRVCTWCLRMYDAQADLTPPDPDGTRRYTCEHPDCGTVTIHAPPGGVS